MYPAKFDYYRAGSVAEAVGLLQAHEDAKVLAGGHSLIPTMKLRLAQPPVLIDIGRIAELSGITQSNGSIRIGSLTTHAEIASSSVLKEQCQLLAEAAGQIGDPAVRHKGTIGGNLAHADPASDLPAVVLALGGIVHMSGPDGDRQVNASDFFVDLLETDLKEEEILTAVEVPVLGPNSGSAYLKFEHPASGYAICGAAAVVQKRDNGTVEKLELCFNGVSATPHHAANVADRLMSDNLVEELAEGLAKLLTGTAIPDGVVDYVVDHYLAIDEPLGDIHASGPYRIELAKVYGKRAIKAARDRA